MPEGQSEHLFTDLALQERVLRRALAAHGLCAVAQRLSADLSVTLPHDALWFVTRQDPPALSRIAAAWPPSTCLPPGVVELRPTWREAIAPQEALQTLTGPTDPLYEPTLQAAGFAAHFSVPVRLPEGSPAVATFAATSPQLACCPAARAPWLPPCISACLAGSGASAPAMPGDAVDPTELADYLCAAVAHDIRNIMSGIIGAVELHRAGVSETQGAVFDAVRRRALDGVAMAESMRDYLHRTRPRELPVTDLSALVARTHDLLGPVLSATLGAGGPRFTLELEPARTLADPGEIQRAVTALVYNAARHGAPEGTISLRTRADARHAFVEVEDDGPGFAPEVLRQAKAPFYTTLPAVFDGLGLAIADGVARVSDGSLSIRPGTRGGAKVIMSLALAPEPRP